MISLFVSLQKTTLGIMMTKQRYTSNKLKIIARGLAMGRRLTVDEQLWFINNHAWEDRYLIRILAGGDDVTSIVYEAMLNLEDSSVNVVLIGSQTRKISNELFEKLFFKNVKCREHLALSRNISYEQIELLTNDGNAIVRIFANKNLQDRL